MRIAARCHRRARSLTTPNAYLMPGADPGEGYANHPEGHHGHTSILKTVEKRWALNALTARDAAAPDFGGVLTLTSPRTDDPLLNVVVPNAVDLGPAIHEVSHLQQVHAEVVARTVGEPLPATLRTPQDYDAFIKSRTAHGSQRALSLFGIPGRAASRGVSAANDCGRPAERINA
jgi:phospholipase C